MDKKEKYRPKKLDGSTSNDIPHKKTNRLQESKKKKEEADHACGVVDELWLEKAVASCRQRLSWNHLDCSVDPIPGKTYTRLTKAQTTVLFLLRNKVIGLSRWLSKSHIRGIDRTCLCTWRDQTIQHVVYHCSRHNKTTLLPLL